MLFIVVEKRVSLPADASGKSVRLDCGSANECATEGQSCIIAGSPGKYADGKFVSKSFTIDRRQNQVKTPCSHKVHGDPIFGKNKSCQFRRSFSAPKRATFLQV